MSTAHGCLERQSCAKHSGPSARASVRVEWLAWQRKTCRVICLCTCSFRSQYHRTTINQSRMIKFFHSFVAELRSRPQPCPWPLSPNRQSSPAHPAPSSPGLTTTSPGRLHARQRLYKSPLPQHTIRHNARPPHRPARSPPRPSELCSKALHFRRWRKGPSGTRRQCLQPRAQRREGPRCRYFW